MRACCTAATSAALLFVLAGCASDLATPSPGSAIRPASPVSPISSARAASAVRPAWYRPAPAEIKKGVYVAEFYTNAILGYDWDTQKNIGPICTIPANDVVNVATDPTGDLIDPDGSSGTVSVFRGPAMCGAKLGSFSGTGGQPSDAATWNAATGTIYVANIQATNQEYGDVAVCTLAAGCSAVLSSPAIRGELFAVAEDRKGNLYASGYPVAGVSGPGSGAALVYWKGGHGKAITLKAYQNATPGGLTLDTHDNLVAFDTFSSSVWVYTGCPKACVAHGPFALKGESVYGRVDAKGNILQVADFEYGQVDVYSYSGTNGISYLYSYSNGMTPSGDVEGIALDPAPKE
jgi:hypothetical protein